MSAVGFFPLPALLPLRGAVGCPDPPHFHPPDTGYGTIYTSDDRGVVFSKSLERHLYTTTGGETDFTNVTSLRGIYITSVLSEGGGRGGALGWGCWAGMRCQPPLCPPDNSIQSVITFDRGGEWVPLRKPKNTTCDSTARSKEEVALPCVPKQGRVSPSPPSLCSPWMGLGWKPSAVGGGCGSGGALGWRGAEP